MADSFIRFDIGGDWVDINALTSIPIGMKFELQVIGGSIVDAALSIPEPTGDIGERLPLNKFYGIKPGENQLWIKSASIKLTSRISIRIDGPFDPSGDYSADYSTDYSQDI